MQIQNPNGQDAIKKSVEVTGENILRELPGLTLGQAVVSGDAMNTPALTQVRRRRTPYDVRSRPMIEKRRDAYDQRQRELSWSEAADFGG